MTKNKKTYVHTRYGHKKALGQNFLKSIPVLKKIIEVSEISKNDLILEIGPGKGILTKKLLEKAGRLIAVEKDSELFEFLQNKFDTQIRLGIFILVHDNIIKFQITDYKLQDYKIVANIPYNITGAILKKFLTEKNKPKSMTLMIQKEVAERIMAKDGKESILSLSVKAYGEPKTIMKVPARYFSPVPKVDSAVIIIKNISRDLFIQNSTLNKSEDFEKMFWKIVHKGFAHKRKKLSSNLKTLQKNTSEKNLLIETLGNKRAEELKLIDWINLVKNTYI